SSSLSLLRRIRPSQVAHAALITVLDASSLRCSTASSAFCKCLLGSFGSSASISRATRVELIKQCAHAVTRPRENFSGDSESAGSLGSAGFLAGELFLILSS